MALGSFSRAELIFGEDGIGRLRSAAVAVFGIGGVGGHAAEALARSGVGRIDLFDDDRVCLTNINRQIIATRKTVGQYKTDAMRERLLDINPDADIRAHRVFYLPETADNFPLGGYDYIIDAVDTVTAKLELAVRARAANVPIISCMGAANKLDPTAFRVADIFQTSVCPLCKVMRHELRKRGIKSLKVVYSAEVPRAPLSDMRDTCATGCICPPGTVRHCTQRRQIPSSNAFVPPVAGLIAAGEVVKYIAEV